MLRWTLTLAGAALLAGCATPAEEARRRAAGEKELAETLADYTPARTLDCIDPTFAGGPQIVGDSLLYRATANTYYRNVVEPNCPALRGDQIVIAELYGSRICKNDRFRLLQRGQSAGIPSGYCRFGEFVEYKKNS
ncbi:hypothetical protein ACBY01_13520 [Sphingomonas sp. ac-8]|uniref:hypothetical protein n=1 Tax=Sphingomonas sp. ac-8 TaxID=3242977 RepID=UPI003A7FCAFD